MRILLINPPYRAVSSAHGLGEQTPLGLLAIGGPLLDAGHDVTLLDAEVLCLSVPQVAEHARRLAPELILTGHGGSTPAHPTVVEMARAIKPALPEVPIVYGGVFPTYHGAEILAAEPSVDIVVRGEGEQTTLELVAALSDGQPLASVPGLFVRQAGRVVTTPDAPPIKLDAYRIGWELIEDWDHYQCWGVGRSAIIQLSRGCPHRCTYCGQRDFWTRWRHRDPERVAAEIGWLHRRHGVNFVDLADENPTTSRRIWRRFLEAMIAQAVPVKVFASIRAGDIVRDADMLHLYKAAGLECCLMGLESTDPVILENISKDSTQSVDREAIRLLRQHGILSMAGQIFGFEQERLSDYWRTFRRLCAYDPDLLNAMYVTPHRWTAFYAESGHRDVVQEDRSKWDYRHQVLNTRHLAAWQVFLAVKALEVALQLRPRVVFRLLAHPDAALRRALRWCTRNAARVWLDEVHDFVLRSRYRRHGVGLFEFWGAPMTGKLTPLREVPRSRVGGASGTC
ncbi:B12-binding domain-containing radical SAM protein [Aromatoleum diolicum]|uniref:Radical SAM protein n=1 Tax=Aromatoleum diolicum TaxID=75796 RepID=A0ABX1QJA4_9RHOO|nr:cobalamin-dependent protein [Aromatoleum diolicum]NMG77641.1 radical SAM protein [Aromatoleum diolicum]